MSTNAKMLLYFLLHKKHHVLSDGSTLINKQLFLHEIMVYSNASYTDLFTSICTA